MTEPSSAADPDQFAFFPVSVQKFALLSLVTFGLYELYWFYRQWQRIRDRRGVRLSPFWRAFFSPIWSFSFFTELGSVAAERQVPLTWSGTVLGILYLGLGAAWILPDPWWLVSLATFVPLIPAVQTVADVNKTCYALEDPNESYSPLNVGAIVVGGLLLLLGVLGTFLPG